jgi:sulfite reductase (ferredoxin)
VQALTWKDKLAGRVSEPLGREIDIFETEIGLRKQGKMEEKLFAETRLRRGVYGQRYDNGQRHDGIASQTLSYPSGELTKGPMTLWDAPGMQRIKIPYGVLTADQMEVLAEVAEEYSDAILHVTTRQDLQLHFVHVEDTPDIMRRLAAVGITTREACGNTVRNVTACPYAGVCGDESFDTTPYAQALTYFLLGHQDAQDFGRKFKIALSGCRQHACALVNMHDLGVIACRRPVPGNSDGREERGFEVYVGGGLGSVPHQAKLLLEFVPEGELLPTAQAVARVFARLGEKKNRQRARLKFLIARLGVEEFKRLVIEERARLPLDRRWTAFLPEGEGDLAGVDRPRKPGAPLGPGARPEGFEAWHKTNVRPQKQPGYAVVTVRLPLGDLTSRQMRGLANLARRFTGDTLTRPLGVAEAGAEAPRGPYGSVRATVEQNIALRWVPEAELPALYQELVALGLGMAGAGTIADITACPGTDTCKLGISSSRGLGAELSHHLAAREHDAAVAGLHIKMSGCFNACGQHHIADIGFLGVSRNVGGRRVPHFQLVVGGQWTENAGSYGLAVGAIPSKRIPEVVDRVTGLYTRERLAGESFQAFIRRIGKAALRTLVEDLLEVPPYEQDPGFYSDWGDPREYTIGDLGVGECAGEVVSPVHFGLAASEREAFEALLHLDQGRPEEAARLAYTAMLTAARTLVRLQYLDVSEEPDEIANEFRTRLVDTRLFADPYAGDKFAQYFLRVHSRSAAGGGGGGEMTAERAHRRIEEAQLFIEAAHACYDRMTQTRGA